MRLREPIIVLSAFGLLAVTWLQLLVHSSPRFPGSGLGLLLGIAAALLVLLPLLYTLAKRFAAVRARMPTALSLPALMTVHVGAGILGPLFAVIHSGHRYSSWLGIALTAVLLLVVLSGLVVRYLLSHVNRELRDKLELLQTARGDLDNAWAQRDAGSRAAGELTVPGLLSAGVASFGLDMRFDAAGGRIMQLADAVTDLELGVAMDESLKRWFRRCTVLHIALSILLYALLAVHIGSEVFFGLRWLQ